ncbi:MAG: ABC transporter ATP-binding protein [Gammaproteobacteria bacterium]|nr:ABC transporter ATP-binding protein [Gammaproteobacteria bacterium]
MSGLRLEGVGKNFGSVTAVADVNLEFPNGKLVCLLGPSGCGKTTLLRLIAGLEEPTAGRVFLDEKDLTGVPAHKREFGMVFQSLALFPHLSVGENIAYALKIRGVGKSERFKRAEELLQLVQLPGVADRHISQLSGGQRQRVAIARALALNPKLFLLDEPLSALDAKLREAMQVELRMLQQRLGITTVVVTHDQREAMTMADLVVVMEHGYTRQVGTPLEIYRNPANTFVADFIGITNLISGKASGGDQVTVAGVPIKVNARGKLTSNTKVTFSVRPEEVHVLSADQAGENRVPGEITFIRDLGASVEITLDCGGVTVLAITTPKERPSAAVGERAMVELPQSACIALPS